jgi:hypothetical protein
MRFVFRVVLVLTTVIAATALLLVYTVVPTTEQKEQTKRATRVGEAYDRQLTRAIDDLGAYVVKRRFEDETDYQKLYDEVRKRMATVPTIPTQGTTAYGREHSREYRTAAGRRGLELRPFHRFTTTLRATIIPRQDFVEVGIDLVKINPLKLLKGFTLTSGSPLRTEVVPAYQKTRKKLLKQRTAPVDAELARDLEKYADDAIKMTKDGADDIDAGRPFFFKFGDKPDTLLTRLETTQRSIATQVSTMVDAFDTSGAAGTSSNSGNTPSPASDD